MSVILLKDYSNTASPVNAYTPTHYEHLDFAHGMIRNKLKKPASTAFTIRILTPEIWTHFEQFADKHGVTVIEADHEQTQR